MHDAADARQRYIGCGNPIGINEPCYDDGEMAAIARRQLAWLSRQAVDRR